MGWNSKRDRRVDERWKQILRSSWAVISEVRSPLIWVITTVTLLMTLLITTHEPPSSLLICTGTYSSLAGQVALLRMAGSKPGSVKARGNTLTDKLRVMSPPINEHAANTGPTKDAIEGGWHWTVLGIAWASLRSGSNFPLCLWMAALDLLAAWVPREPNTP